MGIQLKDPSLLRQQSYIDGEWRQRRQRRTLDVRNPATGDKIGTVPKMGTAETRRAIEAARGRHAGLGEARRRRSAPSSCASGTT